MNGQVVAFRLPIAQYNALCEYAKKNNITVSEATRRAVRWMMILQHEQKKGVRTE